MKHVLHTLLALAVAALVLMTVRHCLAMVCNVTENLDDQLHRGDRVLVVRRSQPLFDRGQLMVFGQQPLNIGRVEALPGDTISLRGQRYLIPQTKQHSCLCPGCQLYWVRTARGHALVHSHQAVGKAYRLFGLPW